MSNNRHWNLDVEFLPSKKGAVRVEDKTYGISFSQADNVKTRVEIVQKDYSVKRYVQFYENDELKYEMCFNGSVLLEEAMLAIHDIAEERDIAELNEETGMIAAFAPSATPYLLDDDE